MISAIVRASRRFSVFLMTANGTRRWTEPVRAVRRSGLCRDDRSEFRAIILSLDPGDAVLPEATLAMRGEGCASNYSKGLSKEVSRSIASFRVSRVGCRRKQQCSWLEPLAEEAGPHEASVRV